jgi:hypothetical protein
MLEIKCSKLVVSCIPQRLEFIWVKECRYINKLHIGVLDMHFGLESVTAITTIICPMFFL